MFSINSLLSVTLPTYVIPDCITYAVLHYRPPQALSYNAPIKKILKSYLTKNWGNNQVYIAGEHKRF